MISSAFATNGDNLIGIAPTARSMGGAVVAGPQDAVSAIFANPAAMCTGPYCPGSQAVAGASIFDATVNARVTTPVGVYTAKSSTKPFIIPAIGIVSPLTTRLRFGFGAYGISGMGVDYRDKGIDLDGNPGNGFEGDVLTQLEIMRLAPNIAYLITPELSVGASLHLVYGSLDLGQGTSHNYTVGGQLGAIYNSGPVSLGLTYTAPEKISYKHVANLDMIGGKDTLYLESPQYVAAGIAVKPHQSLHVEADVKWYNWSDAEGYRDFDWKDQWVFAVGLQYKPEVTGLSLRAGYNYGKSPVRTHQGFNAAGLTYLQGKYIPTLMYEYLRTVGFPAIAEQHATVGLGYRFNDSMELHLGYSHSFTNTITETSAQVMAGALPYTFTSEMREDSYEFGLVWNW